MPLLLCLPIVMSLLAHGWQFQTTIQIPRMLIVAFTLFVATMGIAYLPGMEVLKQRCASLFATLPLWAIPLMQTWRVKKKQEREIELPLAA